MSAREEAAGRDAVAPKARVDPPVAPEAKPVACLWIRPRRISTALGPRDSRWKRSPRHWTLVVDGVAMSWGNGCPIRPELAPAGVLRGAANPVVPPARARPIPLRVFFFASGGSSRVRRVSWCRPFSSLRLGGGSAALKSAPTADVGSSLDFRCRLRAAFVARCPPSLALSGFDRASAAASASVLDDSCPSASRPIRLAHLRFSLYFERIWLDSRTADRIESYACSIHQFARRRCSTR